MSRSKRLYGATNAAPTLLLVCLRRISHRNRLSPLYVVIPGEALLRIRTWIAQQHIQVKVGGKKSSFPIRSSYLLVLSEDGTASVHIKPACERACKDAGYLYPLRPVHRDSAVRLHGATDLTFVFWVNCLSWTGLIPSVVYQISKSERQA